VRQQQLGVVADHVGAGVGIAVLDEVEVQRPGAPTGLAGAAVRGLDPVQCRQQPVRGEPGVGQHHGVEVGRLLRPAHRVGLDER